VLTADLVHARRRGTELHLVALDAEGRERARTVAQALLALADAHVGRTREELTAAMDAVRVGPRDHRLKDGLCKLTLDRCEFDVDGDSDPPAIRQDVFVEASRERAELGSASGFDRRRVLAAVAEKRGTTAEAIERALFADLRGAHVLARFDRVGAEGLVRLYEQAQPRAVLLRAVRVTVDVACASAGALRVLFRRLRFFRLLHTIVKTEQGHRVTIDGPFSLFESSTKYGLQLAMVLPALESCDAWRLEADVRWGKDRLPLTFRLSGRASGEAGADATASELPDEVEALRSAFANLGTAWRVSVNTDILELPGIGLSVPDLVFERRTQSGDAERVYLEVMGFWSRAAVWKRVELVQAGLPVRILFAVSAHLRVSEEVLGDDVPAALYVYKRAMNARTVAERLDALARR
jgi:predicted nuclease of restriction endonuclease-like RecB superfamily